MPIQRVKKFLETEDIGRYHSLGIESEHLKRCVKEIAKRNIHGVFGCPVFGFKERNLDFLNELPVIKQIWFWEIDLDNLEGLYSLKELEYFGIHERRPSIDFSLFENLSRVVWHPIRGDHGLGTLPNLEELDVWRFRPKDKDYSNIEVPKSVTKLDLNWCNPSTLEGMPSLPKLEELQIHYCRNLKYIDSLLSFAPNLKRLVITRCANLEDYKVIECKEWEKLIINIRGKYVANKK